jgi:4-hydroxymandelate oxidase
LLNLHDYEAAARGLLSPDVFAYVAGGSDDEVTLRDARSSFERWRLLPRVMRGLREVSAATSVLGHEVAMPVLVAPTGAQCVCHGDGELATARAARAAGTVFTLSTPSTVAMEEVAKDAGPWWFQLYLFRDRGVTRELVARAKAAGASALVVTVDFPVSGRRERDERNQFTLPPGMSFVHMPKPPSAPSTGSAVAAAANTIFDPTLSWEDLDWLASLSELPLVPKGILHPDDARRAVDHGARAVIVSNHGGRQLDSAVTALDALPDVVDAVAGRVEVLVDGGVRRGTDILKALALGARAVLIGRPIAWGLAVGGEEGARSVLELVRAELLRDLTLCGLGSPAEVKRSLIVPAATRTDSAS